MTDTDRQAMESLTAELKRFNDLLTMKRNEFGHRLIDDDSPFDRMENVLYEARQHVDYTIKPMLERFEKAVAKFAEAVANQK